MISVRLAGVLTVIIILGPNPYPQCDDTTFARANPGLCFPGPFGPMSPNGGGGGGDGGILGTIGHLLHGLTGGLL